MKKEKGTNLLERYNAANLLERYNAGEANLSWASLSGANLSGANLSGANLSGADLSGADLSGANLYEANLSGADLSGANLYEANLSGADLSRADLSGANLSGADLSGTDLYGANLCWANLSGADLSGADLSGTVLDPRSAPPSDKDIADAGLQLRSNGQIWGWRTAKSALVGETTYKHGRVYEAPQFSWSALTDCHPGLYFAGLDYLAEHHSGAELVRVVAWRHETIKTIGGKWRARKLLILPKEVTE